MTYEGGYAVKEGNQMKPSSKPKKETKSLKHAQNIVNIKYILS